MFDLIHTDSEKGERTHNKSRKKIVNVLSDLAVLLIFFIVFMKHFYQYFTLVFGGREAPVHILNILKISQAGCTWGNILSLYNDVNFSPYELVFHYPPLTYLSSLLVCNFGVDYRLAVAVANLIWLFLGYSSIVAACAIVAKNRLASLVAAFVIGSVFTSDAAISFINDPGWRMASFALVSFSLWTYMKLIDFYDRLWAWLLMGFALGATILVHPLAFLASGIALMSVILSSRKNRVNAFAKLRVLLVLFGCLFVASLFYLPLAIYSVHPFGWELQFHATVKPPKVAEEFSNIVSSYSNLGFAPIFLMPFTLFSLIAGIILGNKAARMIIVSYLVSHVALIVGNTPGHLDYLFPTIALGVASVSLSLYFVVKKMKLLPIAIPVLAVLFILMVYAYKSTTPTSNGTDWEPDLIAAAIKKYDHLKQDKICYFSSCLNDRQYEDKTALAIALRRPEESTSLIPITATFSIWYESEDSIKQAAKKLKEARCSVILVFKPRFEESGCLADFKEYFDLVADFELKQRVKLMHRWMEIYERKSSH